MKRLALLAIAASVAGTAAAAAESAVPVTPETFPRAETDLHLSRLVKDAGLGKFRHERAPPPIDKQRAVKADRNILTSDAVFDLDAGPVTVTLPDAKPRYLSLQIIDEDGYTPEVDYTPGMHTFTKQGVGTRYAFAALRVFADPDDPKDLAAANALQDAVIVEQPGGPGAFQIPNWDAAQQAEARAGLLALAQTLSDAKGMFGPKGKVDPVRHLIGSASAWGSLPIEDLLIVEAQPAHDDGRTIYRLELKDAPEDGFWSVSVYNDRGFFEPNPEKAYSLASVQAKPGPDGTVAVQFGGCGSGALNCLPTPPGWSCILRLYRPREEALEGKWAVPPLNSAAPPAAAK